MPPVPVIARAGRASVRDYGGQGPAVLFVPSLINPPDVLDLDEQRSLLRWLAGAGFRPLLVDWGAPAAGEHDLSIAGHIETMLVPLIDAIGAPLALAGYCLGGTMALAAAMLRPVTALALIATPWRFGTYPDSTRAALDDLWRAAEPTVDALGILPMEILQSAFWRLDPARTIAKYEAHGTRDPADRAARAFVRLEDWANDGPPLTRGAARELFLDLFRADLPSQGRWQVGGAAIDPARLAMPVLEIASTTDHIVPAATTPGMGERIDLALGHVGMVVGGRARQSLWEPLAEWLSRVTSAR
jgi:polyhydroxyalkanoate synthase